MSNSSLKSQGKGCFVILTHTNLDAIKTEYNLDSLMVYLVNIIIYELLQ